MTNNEILDKILLGYLHGLKLKLENNPKYRRLTFNLVVKAFDKEIEDWHIEFLRNQLFTEGFLKESGLGDGEPYELTPLGIKAAKKDGGWYKSILEDNLFNSKLKTETLLSLKRSKHSLIISIFAIIIPTIISVYSLWTSKKSPTKEEQQILQQRIEKWENLQNENKPISIDSLKKN